MKRFIKEHPIAIAFILMFCFALGMATVQEGAQAPTTEELSIEEQSCQELSTLGNDIDAGILTDAELRERVKVLYNIAKDSKSLGKTAQMFLSAATSGEEDRLRVAYLSLIVLCQDINK